MRKHEIHITITNAVPFGGRVKRPHDYTSERTGASRAAHSSHGSRQVSPTSSHGGAGTRINQQLLDSNALGVNLNFLIRGRLQPGGGIGHHFHNSCEEMLFILDGEAEFTVDGRT